MNARTSAPVAFKPGRYTAEAIAGRREIAVLIGPARQLIGRHSRGG